MNSNPLHHAINKQTLALLTTAFLVVQSAGEAKDLRPYQVAALKEILAYTAQTQKADDELIIQIDLVADGLEKYFRKRRGKARLPLSDYDTRLLTQELTRLAKTNPYETNMLNPTGGNNIEKKAGSFALPDALSTTSNNPYSDAKSANPNNASGITPTSSPIAPDTISSMPDKRASEPGANSGAPSTGLLDSTVVRNTSSPFNPAKLDQKTSKFSRERLVLSIDPTLNWSSARALRAKMPDKYNGTAGTIHVVFNDQDTVLVWGADSSGRPVFDRTRKRFKLVAITMQSY